MKPLALLLIAVGIIGLVWGGISYNRQRTVFEIGGMKATATEHRNIPIAPVVGLVALLGGVALFVQKRTA
jgi:hypothetical protein